MKFEELTVDQKITLAFNRPKWMVKNRPEWMAKYLESKNQDITEDFINTKE